MTPEQMRLRDDLILAALRCVTARYGDESASSYYDELEYSDDMLDKAARRLVESL